MKRAKKGMSRALPAAAMTALLLLCFAPLSSTGARARQSKEPFAPFWTRFKAALAKNDRKAVASMTRHCKCGQMPFDTDEQFLDEWYDGLRSKSRCLARAKPAAYTREGKQTYSIICRTDGDELVFERIGGDWKLVNVNPAP